MKMPMVSVILTSFNHAAHVCQAIDSVLQQTFTDFELIILDDASSDGSWELIEAYSDPRIRMFRSTSRGQIVHSMNLAISAHAQGDYIAIHHSDDLWSPTKLACQVEILEAQRDIGAVFTWAQIIDEHGAEISNDWFHLDTSDRWQVLNQLFRGINRLSHPSAVVRRQCYEAVGVYRHGLLQTDDADMWSRLLLKFPIHVIDAPLTIHRKFSNQSNISGVRSDVVIRTSTEWGYVRRNFLQVAGFEEIVAIFPSLTRYLNPEGCDVQFLMAMACLYECNDRNAWYLGLRWIFELFNESVRRQKIAELYSFTEFDFFDLSGRFDVHFVDGETQRNKQIEQLKGALHAAQSECGQLSMRLKVREVELGNYVQALEDSQGSLASHIETLAKRDAALKNRDEALAVDKLTIAALTANIRNLETDTAQLRVQREVLRASIAEHDRSITNRNRSNAALMSRLRELTSRLSESEADLKRARSHPWLQLTSFLS